MITAKQAAEKAIQYLCDMTGMPKQVTTLEEIEYDEENTNWMVTIGYPKGQQSLIPLGGPKEYKQLKVRGKDGEVLAMKIRTLE